LKDISASTEI